jgi:hypothetical protein
MGVSGQVERLLSNIETASFATCDEQEIHPSCGTGQQTLTHDGYM